MNSKINSILYEEGIYHIPDKKEFRELDLHGRQDSVILCLFIKDDFSHPGDEELVLAEKIMTAIDVGAGDYAWAYSKAALNNYDFSHSYIFIFHSGEHVDEKDYPFNVWLEKNKSIIIRTHSLDVLISDIEKKKDLWRQLKIFKKEGKLKV